MNIEISEIMKKYKIGYTTGVFDMFHIGHLNILRRAKDQCDYLIVGVSSDDLVCHEKNKRPIIPMEDRMAIIDSIKYVDQVVVQYNKNKLAAWELFKFDVMFVGSDWKGTQTWNNYEKEFASIGVDIVYLPHTEGISSSLILERILKSK